jgi:sorting nexin-25
MFTNTHIAFVVSLAVALFACALPRFTHLQLVLLSPVLLLSSFSAIVLLLVGTTIYLDTPGTHASLTQRRREALRPLAFTSPSAWTAVLSRQAWEVEDMSRDDANSSLLRTQLSERLDTVLGLIKASFINSWYARISPSPAFPTAVEGLLRHAIEKLVERNDSVDWSALLVSRILPILRDHLHHYRAVEHLSSSSSTPTASALPLPLPARHHPALSSQLHLPAGAPSPVIETHLRGLLGRALERLLPENDRTEVVVTAVREIALGAGFLPSFEMLCDSDFWNRQIDEKGGRYLHEQ